MCLGVLPVCVYSAHRPEEGENQIPVTGVIDSCELPYGCWELNTTILQEQQVYLTAEPSLQTHTHTHTHHSIIHIS